MVTGLSSQSSWTSHPLRNQAGWMLLLGGAVVVECWCSTSPSPKNSSQVLGHHQDLIPIPHLVGVQGPTAVLEFLGPERWGHVEDSHLVAW